MYKKKNETLKAYPTVPERLQQLKGSKTLNAKGPRATPAAWIGQGTMVYCDPGTRDDARVMATEVLSPSLSRTRATPTLVTASRSKHPFNNDYTSGCGPRGEGDGARWGIERNTRNR